MQGIRIYSLKQATLQLLSIIGNDERFEEVYNEGREGGPKNMCKVLDRIENKGVSIGVDLMAKLIDILMGENRYDDVKKVTKDAAYRMQLMHQYGLK